MFYLAIILTLIGLFLLWWSERHQRAAWHTYILTIAGLFWLAGAVIGFINLGLGKGLLFLVASLVVGGIVMPQAKRS